MALYTDPPRESKFLLSPKYNKLIVVGVMELSQPAIVKESMHSIAPCRANKKTLGKAFFICELI